MIRLGNVCGGLGLRMARSRAREGPTAGQRTVTVGWPFAFGITRAAAGTQAFSVPLLTSVGVDGAALMFALGAALVTGLLFGVAPALQLAERTRDDERLPPWVQTTCRPPAFD